MIFRKKHPTFQRPNVAQKKRVGEAWRKPRGIDSKQRLGLKWAGAKPCVGYRTQRETRGMHASGFEEVLVHNTAELARLKLGKQAARIAKGVGARKAKEIRLKARELGVKVLN